MADQNTEQYVLQLTAEDRASTAVRKLIDEVAKTEKGAENLTRRFLTAEETAEKLGSALANQSVSRALDDIADRAARGELNAHDLVEELQRLGATEGEINQVAASIERLSRAEASRSTANSGGGSGGASSALDTVDLIGSRSSQIFSGLGNSELANTAGLVGDVAGSFATMNPLLIASASAGAGFAIVLGDIQRQLEATEKAAQSYADKTVEVAELISSGATSEDVRAMINEQRGPANYIREQLEALSAYENELENMDRSAILTDPALQDRVESIFKDISSITGTNVEDIGQLRANIEKLTEAGSKYDLQVLQLNQLLESGALAGNDAAAAGEKSAESWRNFIASWEQGFENLGDAAKEFFDKGADAWEQKQADLADAQIARSDNIQAALEELRAAEDAVTAATEKAADAQRAYDDALTEHNNKIGQIETERFDKEASLRAKAETAQQEQVAKAEKQREDDLEDHLKKLAEIEARYALDFQTAVGERDANAAKRAEDERAKSIQDEQSSYATRAQRLDESLQEQQKVLDARLEEQIAAINDAAKKATDAENERYSKQYKQLKASLEKAMTEEENAYRRADAIRADNAFKIQYWNNYVATRYDELGNATQAMAERIGQSAAQINAYAQQAANIPLAYAGAGAGFGTGGTMYPAVNSHPTLTESWQNTSNPAAVRPVNAVVNVNGMGYSLSQVLNSSLGMINTLFTPGGRG